MRMARYVDGILVLGALQLVVQIQVAYSSRRSVEGIGAGRGVEQRRQLLGLAVVVLALSLQVAGYEPRAVPTCNHRQVPNLSDYLSRSLKTLYLVQGHRLLFVDEPQRVPRAERRFVPRMSADLGSDNRRTVVKVLLRRRIVALREKNRHPELRRRARRSAGSRQRVAVLQRMLRSRSSLRRSAIEFS